jgi:dihydropteroate synthase
MPGMTDGFVWRCRDHAFACGERTLIMGIVNVTPDSFSDGGRSYDPDDAVKHALEMVADGADILDVGGESTRPGADPVPADDEIRRVIPVIERLSAEVPEIPLSIDTRKSEVARAAVAAGASIVNDISAGGDPETFDLVKESGAGLVLMHMRGDPTTMQESPRYGDVVEDVRDYLAGRIGAAVAAGIQRQHLCVDPGIGFGKSVEHNLALLHDVATLHELRVPILVGVSRKRFLGELTGVQEPAERLEGTAGAVAWCAGEGVDIVRVHDVKEMTRVVRVVDAIVKGAP